MREKKSNSFILFQFKGGSIKVVKWKEYKGSQIEIDGYVVQEHQGLSEKERIKSAIKIILDKISYHSEKVILLITHQRASSRYFRFPSHDTKEVEDMINLQVAKILPYPPEELIVGYQIIDIDKDGFSHVNLILLHKSVVEELIDMMKEFNLQIDSVYVDTYGIQQLLEVTRYRDVKEILAVMLDFPYTGIAILKNQKICLSRFITINRDQAGWQDRLSKNIIETQSLYLRESQTGPIKKIVLIGPGNMAEESKAMLEKMMVVPVETISVPKDLRIHRKVEIDNFPDSLMDVLGFIFKRPTESLNLLPSPFKDKKKRAQQAKNNFKLIALAIAILFLSMIASLKCIDNKKLYLNRLDKELVGIQTGARGLEAMAKRLRILDAAHRERTKLLDFFYAIHKTKPEGVFITEIRFNAEGNTPFILEGLSQKIDSVFEYASNLKNLRLFDEEEIKVNYATSRELKEDEMIKFEIVFQRKK